MMHSYTTPLHCLCPSLRIRILTLPTNPPSLPPPTTAFVTIRICFLDAAPALHARHAHGSGQVAVLHDPRCRPDGARSGRVATHIAHAGPDEEIATRASRYSTASPIPSLPPNISANPYFPYLQLQLR